LPGHQYDAFKQITDIVGRATQLLRVVDNWIDVSVLDTLSARRSGVTIQVLTKKPFPGLKAAVDAFNKQHGPIEVRLTAEFHDRFVYIDQLEVWALGASLRIPAKQLAGTHSSSNQP